MAPSVPAKFPQIDIPFPPRGKDLRGRRFNRLVVQTFAGYDKHFACQWRAICDCGVAIIVTTSRLTSGNTKSCGCFKRELDATLKLKPFNFRHGNAPRGAWTAEYRCWVAMLARCHNPHTKAFKDYGGRGISVCDRWRDFANFLADMGRRPKGLTLDRINNDGNYELSNCRWATALEQRHNQRRVKNVIG